MPAGFPHEVRASQVDSLSIGIAVMAYRWLDVFREAIELLCDDRTMQRELPFGFLVLRARVMRNSLNIFPMPGRRCAGVSVPEISANRLPVAS